MNDECPICEAEGYNSGDKRRVCDECGHYDESYHHGHEADQRRKARERAERDRRRLRRSGGL